jgi:predicted HTH domain antitoxin
MLVYMAVISIRPTQEIEEKIEELSRIKRMEKSALVRNLLEVGIKEELKEHALDMFIKRRISLGKAAEIAGISFREMLEMIKERDVPLHISARDIKSDFEAAMK